MINLCNRQKPDRDSRKGSQTIINSPRWLMTPESERKKNYRNNRRKQIMGLIKDSAGIFKALVLEGFTFQNAREN